MAKRGNPTTTNTGAVLDARATGYGMIQPGAGRNRAAEANMDSVEKKYVKGQGRTESSFEAVRRARRANKQKPVDD